MSAGKIPFSSAPEDDRHLPEMHLALYNDVVVFDQVSDTVARQSVVQAQLSPLQCALARVFAKK